ncbi:GNAT superfamily N-acetyltransferase [Xanthomonas sp. 60]
MPLIRFRQAVVEDIAALWELRTRCVRQTCSSHYPPEIITPWAASPPPAQYAALLGAGGGVVAETPEGRLLGYGVFDPAGNAVDALFVDPVQSGQGIGQALLQRLLAQADPTRAVELSASLNAVAFYRHAGFEVVGPQRYAHPSGVELDAITMRRPVSGH